MSRQRRCRWPTKPCGFAAALGRRLTRRPQLHRAHIGKLLIWIRKRIKRALARRPYEAAASSVTQCNARLTPIASCEALQRTMRRNYPPPRRSSAGVRLVIPIAINTAATLSPRVHRRQSALRSLMTSPRQLSGIMKAGVACDRGLIKLRETR